jgi:hypothetical protein
VASRFRRRAVALLVAAVAALGGLVYPDGLEAQISPGPLAAAHARLEGSLQCTACHGKGGETAMTAQCLDCHKEVAWLRARRLGLHGREGRDRCAACHPDHAGPDFKLVTWTEGDSTRFDHRRTGWPLDGRHRETACLDCHRSEFRRSPAAALVKARPAGWVGLDRGCASCHDDAHRGALAADCLECHDTRDWKPTPGFDHARTNYPLTGKHVSVRCDECHLSPRVVVRRTSSGQPVPVYRPLRYQACSDCHTDPHAGALGVGCARCHRTEGFARIERSAFDHDRTRYPLRGKHAAVACGRCHDFGATRGKRPPFATCASCHSDPHAGTATLVGRALDCASCHDVGGFRPATLTVTRHRSTRYPLEGKHQAVACSRCHAKNPPGVPRARLGSAGTQMRPAFGRCRDCHADDHATQVAATSDCRDCHAVAGWTPSTFGVAAHASTRLPLEGRHADIACADCHGTARKGLPPLPAAATLGRAAVALKLAERECGACHLDPHAGRYSPGGARPRAEGCAACHDARRFRPSTVSVTAHDGYGFRLEGAHRAVPCVACHDDMERPALSASLVGTAPRGARVGLTRGSRACTECHADPHDGQFAARPAKAGCESCHGVDSFRPAPGFDHERDTPFSLRGAHARVECTACHTVTRLAGGRMIVVYAPLSGRCESCHTAPRRAS